MTVEKTKLTIFMSFPSSVLTDCLTHGDGLLGFQYIHRVAERGHNLHVVCNQVEIKSALPDNITLYPLYKKNANGHITSRLEYFLRSRSIFAQLNQKYKFDLIHELNPGFLAMSLAFVGVTIPIIIGPIQSRWPLELNHLSVNYLQSIKLKVMSVFKSLFTKLIWYLQKQCATILLISTPDAGFTLGFSEQNQKIRILPVGIDSSQFSPVFELENTSYKTTILYLAKLEIRKGIFTLLEAFAEISNQVPNCQLLIAGSGSQKEAIDNYVAKMTCCDRITFLGDIPRDQVAHLMASCSVYCLPSYREPFGISLLEAIACGKPIVATDCGGPKYIVSDRGGRRVPPKDAHALAKALVEILISKELQEQMGQFNRDIALNVYDWDKVIDQLEAIYQEATLKDSI